MILIFFFQGTLRDNMWKGEGDEFKSSDSPISCTFCNETSHPSRDCPLKGLGTSKLDQQVSSFLDEVGDSKYRRGFSEEELDIAEHRDAYEELLCIISGKPYHDNSNNNNNNTNNHPPSYPNQGNWGNQSESHYGPPPTGNPNPSPYGPPAGNPSPYGPPVNSGWNNQYYN